MADIDVVHPHQPQPTPSLVEYHHMIPDPHAMRYWPNAGEGNHAMALQQISGIPGGVFIRKPPATYIGRHRTIT